jgi:UDP-N-acetylglucosamine 2-epimerase
MPEEINRVVADHLSSLLFCPSQTAVDNLEREGITKGVHLVGDVMADALTHAAERARARSDILKRLGVEESRYFIGTVHRAENTDDGARLSSILEAFSRLDAPVIFPVHPRTRKRIAELGLEKEASLTRNPRLVDPLGYLDMVRLMLSARTILTDSGGIQKEAYWLGVPCITLREETEWVETVDAGWNVLAGSDTERIVRTVLSFVPPRLRPPLYGDGHAAKLCVDLLDSLE